MQNELRPVGVVAPFHYTHHLEEAIAHILRCSPAFAHVRYENILAGCSQSRAGGDHGVYATIQGLRFAGGVDTVKTRRGTYRWPPVVFEGREILYVIYFMLPRFADLSYRQKLTTIFHELYHISPRCDGDLRRFPGRNYAHGHSREVYNARLQPWIDEYLGQPGTAATTHFLEATFAELEQRHQRVVGRQLRMMRPVRVG